MPLREPADRAAYDALADRIAEAADTSALRALVPDIRAFEGGAFVPELGTTWVRRWSLVTDEPPPPEWWT